MVIICMASLLSTQWPEEGTDILNQQVWFFQRREVAAPCRTWQPYHTPSYGACPAPTVAADPSYRMRCKKVWKIPLCNSCSP